MKSSMVFPQKKIQSLKSDGTENQKFIRVRNSAVI